MNIKKLIKSLFMAQLEHKYLKEQAPAEVIEALKKYRLQNPAKYESKKAELFARYGLNDVEAEVVDTPDVDPEIEELEEKAKKVGKPKNNAK